MTQAVRNYVGAWTVWFMAGHDHPYPSNELQALNTTEYFEALKITEQIKPILIGAMTGVYKFDIAELIAEQQNKRTYTDESINVE